MSLVGQLGSQLVNVAQPAGDRLEQSRGKLRVLEHGAGEVRRVNLHRLRLLDGGHRGRARLAVEHAHLADDFPLAELGEDHGCGERGVGALDPDPPPEDDV